MESRWRVCVYRVVYLEMKNSKKEKKKKKEGNKEKRTENQRGDTTPRIMYRAVITFETFP